LTQSDRVGCYKSRDLGFMGMACKHCGGQPGYGRFFPNSVRSLAQTTTSQTVLKHMAGKCRFCPPHVRSAVLDLQRQQVAREGLATGRPRYGSRKIFFQRIWGRLHGGAVPDTTAEQDCGGSKSDETASLEEERSFTETRELQQAKKRKNRFGALPVANTNNGKRLKISEVLLPTTYNAV
jgi:hypothetical protein